MKKIYLVTLLSAVIMILLSLAVKNFIFENGPEHIKVGFVFDGDASTAYTGNFLKAMHAVEQQYDGKVEAIPRYNVAEGDETDTLQELVDESCDLIITTSYGYGIKAKEFAQKYPDIEFCQATCSNANEEPVLENYHTFMGEIYQGRYISGVMAGLKLAELVDEGVITEEQCKVGYVGAYSHPEVISGYTAFILGVRSIVPQAKMTVTYTNTWSSYALEKKAAEGLIDEGCVIIAQHSDTTGPAVACENAEKSKTVYHIAYNNNMINIAPTTYLTGCRINWAPYVSAAVKAVLSNKKIEDCVNTGENVHGNDASAGFDQGWVEMLKINDVTVAENSKEVMENLIEEFKENKIQVFKGDYIGVDPDNENDTYDLSKGYIENENCSAPSFHYILKDVVTIK